MQLDRAWVLVPSRPRAVIHFLGGAFFAAAPQISYKRLLERLARAEYAVVATPFLNNTLDHGKLASEVHQAFQAARQRLYLDYLPTYGIGHSMGCKLHLLLCCLHDRDRAGNALVAYNNYNVRRSIPLFEELAGAIPEISGVEFTPSPAATRALVVQRYEIANNLLVRFHNDTIDEIADLARLLGRKFPETVTLRSLPGNHLTSMGIDLNWQTGKAFSPLDAVGQWLSSSVHKDNRTLEDLLLQWLRRRALPRASAVGRK